MKKSIILLIILLLTLSFVYADKTSEFDKVKLVENGEEGEYTTVNILMNGDNIISDVPGVLYVLNSKTRTLIPISFIAKKIGADVKWDNKNKIATIIHNGKKIDLKINSATSYVDGKPKKLPSNVPAKLMAYQGNYRTMVPVRFVAEELGYEVAWEGETRTVLINKPKQSIKGMVYDDSGVYPKLRFKVTGDVSASALSVDGESVGTENKLIIDFYNANLKLSKPLKYGKYLINDYIQEINDVTLEEVKQGPINSVKAVVSLGYYRHGDVSYDKKRNEIVVELINSVKSVELQNINGYNAVVIETNENPAYNPITTNTDYVLIDVIHSKLSDEAATINVGKGGIKSFEYKQYDNSTEYDKGTRFSRIKINLEAKVKQDNVFIDQEGKKIFVYLLDQVTGMYDYARNLEEGTGEFKLDLITNKDYTVHYSKTNNRLRFSIPKSNLNKKLEVSNNKLDDGVVYSINMSEDSSNYNFDIYLAKNTGYTKSSSDGFKLSFSNKILKNSDNRKILVVVDAGHGGHDPGANVGKLREKDFVLKASKMLKKKLENAGFKVYMTRDKDRYVKLYDRSGVANQLKANLFISLHVNAAGNPKARGVEVLYADDKKRNNKKFARYVQNELIKATGQVNRGIIRRNDLVVTRTTKMDAILVELGFLTNPGDKAKLLQDSYLETCAESIVKGVLKFLGK